jgi:hypothetical protein
MGPIFFYADSVISWLGEELTSFRGLFAILRTAADHLTSEPAQPKEALLKQALLENSMSLNHWDQAMLDLFHHRYWSRAWVMQEVLLNTNLWLFDGSQYLNFGLIADFVSLRLLEYHPIILGRGIEVIIINYMTRDRIVYGAGSAGKPVNLLMYNSLLGCSEPRDRIYSALAPLRAGDDFHADYGEEEVALYLRAFILCTKRDTHELPDIMKWAYIADGLGFEHLTHREELLPEQK